MEATAPDGCWDAGRSWSGQPLETANLRLTATGLGLQAAIEHRISKSLLGKLGADLMTPERALLSFEIDGVAANRDFYIESVRRYLRMLFDNFAVALAEVEISPENQFLAVILDALGFAPAESGRRALSAEAWQKLRASRKQVFVVAAALIDSDGRVLLARRPEGKTMSGLWEFPGGKLDPGETPEAALVRELHEELGLDITESCAAPIAFVSHDYDHFHLLMPLYAIRQWRGNPHPREGQALAWVAKERLSDYPMPPADIPLIATLRDWL